MDLHSLLVECAAKEGFPLAGTVDLDLAKNHLEKEIEHYDQWIQSGYAGSMEYLVRGRDRRANPKLVFPAAESVFCVAIPYPRKPAGAPSPEEGPRYARYLQGRDYHLELTERLERVMQAVKAQWSGSGELSWKICVDTSAILERAWAALAGLGWIGKNTLLIHPKEGSYLFLAVVLISQKTGRAPSLMQNYCGHCTRCLKACPTQALLKPRVLDSNQCISYWTLEKRGELTLPEDTQQKIGTWVAGCDICQEACPFNQKPTKHEEANPRAIPKNATQLFSWDLLHAENIEQYKARIKDSAMNRIKPEQFKRNLRIAAHNASKYQT